MAVADIDRAARILDRHHALQAELPAPIGADRLRHLPVHRGVEHGVEIIGDRKGDVRSFGHMVLEIGQLEFLAQEIIGGPGGVRGEARHARQGQPRRRGEAGATAAFAVAADDGVDRQRDRVELRRLAALDHRPIEALVLVDIELEHLGARYLPADLLDADGRQRRDAEPGARSLCGVRHGALALPVEQPLQRRRRQEQGHGNLLAHHLHGHVDGLDAGQDVGHQIAIIEGSAVAILGDLVVRGTIDIVEDRPRQPPFGKPAEILDIVTLADPTRAEHGPGRLAHAHHPFPLARTVPRRCPAC